MRKRKKIYLNILLLIIGILFNGCNSGKNNPNDSDNFDNNILNTSTATISSQLKNEYLFELNKVRSVPQDCGSMGIYYEAIALTWNDKLYKAADEHSYDLATSNTFSHTGSGQATDITGVALGKASIFEERIEAYGYKHSLIGENIAAGINIDTAKKVIAQLMESDGHCSNIMHPDFREIGMAMIKNTNSKYTYYWTQNFGTAK